MTSDKVCSPTILGGLGIKDIGKFNATLLAKWKWRLGMEEGGAWRDILDSIYGSWRDMKISMVNNKSSF